MESREGKVKMICVFMYGNSHKLIKKFKKRNELRILSYQHRYFYKSLAEIEHILVTLYKVSESELLSIQFNPFGSAQR